MIKEGKICIKMKLLYIGIGIVVVYKENKEIHSHFIRPINTIMSMRRLSNMMKYTKLGILQKLRRRSLLLFCCKGHCIFFYLILTAVLLMMINVVGSSKLYNEAKYTILDQNNNNNKKSSFCTT